MFFIKINELFIIILRNKTYRGFKMIKIDDKKIIVSSFDELKEVLEEYNTYNYIFLWMKLVLQKIYLLDLMF